MTVMAFRLLAWHACTAVLTNIMVACSLLELAYIDVHMTFMACCLLEWHAYTAARMTFMACSSMSLRAVSEARRAAEASSSTSMEATDSDDRFSRAVARRDLHSTHMQQHASGMAKSHNCLASLPAINLTLWQLLAANPATMSFQNQSVLSEYPTGNTLSKHQVIITHVHEPHRTKHT
jgi:hypothetical protein